MGSLTPPAHLHGGRSPTSLNLLHLSNPQLPLQGWQAGRLARQDVTAERSRLGAISFHPTLPRVLVEPNSEQSIPRAVITLLFCLRCNPPVLVRGKRVRRLIEKHFMHVPRYGIPQTILLATSHSPRLLGRPQKRLVKPSLASFSHTRHAGPSRSFPALHTSSRPGLSWVVPTVQPGRHVSVGTVRLLGIVTIIYPFRH